MIMIKLRKLLVLPLVLLFLAEGSHAQTPKWVEKAKQAVFSVVTYDKEGKILNTGNGFFVSEEGLALSDYTLFKGAERAVIISAERSEEHTSELQSRQYLVCRLLLAKKK